MEESKNPFLLPRVSLSQYQPWTRADAVRPRVSAANHFPPQVQLMTEERAAGYLEDVEFDY